MSKIYIDTVRGRNNYFNKVAVNDIKILNSTIISLHFSNETLSKLSFMNTSIRGNRFDDYNLEDTRFAKTSFVGV